MSDDFRVLEPVIVHREQCKYCGEVGELSDPEAFTGWESAHRERCIPVVRR